MNNITGDREAVLQLLNETILQLGHDAPKARKAGMRSLNVKTDTQWSHNRDQIIESLQRGYERAQTQKLVEEAIPKTRSRSITVDAAHPERAVETSFAPRDRTLAVFQAAMDEYLSAKSISDASVPKKKSVKTRSMKSAVEKAAAPEEKIRVFFDTKASGRKARSRVTKTRVLVGEQFDNLDPRWIEVVWEKTKSLLKGKHKFITHKSATDFRFELAENSLIAIIGDWGGGNAAAQAVAKQIKSLNPTPDHVIHLGDVYYAGTAREIKERFLKYWPTPPAPGRSFALNSNHEMYSGGYGYFDVTLKEFKQPASYFSLGNKNWRFIGLDTGYVDHDLNNEQVEWLAGQFTGSSNPKTILMSHHQLFSAYENTNAKNLQRRVQPFLDKNKIYGWIWGHEHLAVVY
jgi:hypothetical protein